MEKSNPFKSSMTDAVMWKAERLWLSAADPDSEADAVEDITAMLLCIDNDVKRLSYTTTISKQFKIKVLPKYVKDASAAAEKAKKAKVEKARTEIFSVTKEELDLPMNFTGDLKDVIEFGVYLHEKCFYSKGNRGNLQITNFTMKILYHAETGDENAYRLIALENVYGHSAVININTDDFVSLGSFKKIIARKGNFIFKGQDSDLSRLSEYLQKYEIKAKFINTLGWQQRGNFWAWGNGLFTVDSDDAAGFFIPVDKYGIVDYADKSYYIPACAEANIEKDDLFVNEKRFIYREPKEAVHFEEWANLMYITYKNKSISAILFYIGSLFTDLIKKELKSFPLLYLFGPPGSGKSKLAESLLEMFGIKQDAYQLGNGGTEKGFMRLFAQLKNSIVWLDEYLNTLPLKYIAGFKGLYEFKGYTRARMTNDFSTDTTPVHSCTLMSGQDMPTADPALLMRCVMETFEEGKFSDEQRDAFKRLKELEAEGLSSITCSLFRHRIKVELLLKDKFEEIKKQTVKEVNNRDMDDRYFVNVAGLLVFYKLFENTYKFPFTYEEAKAYLIEGIKTQYFIAVGSNDVGKFWEIIESLFHQNIIREAHDFVLKDKCMYLKLSSVYAHYLKELKQRGDMVPMSKSTLDHYLKLDKQTFLGYENTRFPDGSQNKCYKFLYSRLGINLIKISGTHDATTLARLTDDKMREMGVETDAPKPDDLPF